jgi:hypothetical protein
MTDPTGTAEQLRKFAKLEGKPILASWMGAEEVERGEDILNRANIPTFKYPDRAARAFYYMWRYSYNLRALYETPSAGGNGVDVVARRAEVEEMLQRVRQSGRTLLTEFESKKVLAAYDIPTVETHVARSVNEAVKIAEKIGYPVVLKLHSETVTHKTDVGGVQLNLRNATAVRQAWKAIESAVGNAGRTLSPVQGPAHPRRPIPPHPNPLPKEREKLRPPISCRRPREVWQPVLTEEGEEQSLRVPAKFMRRGVLGSGDMATVCSGGGDQQLWLSRAGDISNRKSNQPAPRGGPRWGRFERHHRRE